MHYDWIEIGTSFFDTLIQDAGPDEVGMSVEPITEYLDQLPNKANVRKINCAISPHGLDMMYKFYYIPQAVAEENGLHRDLCGCNSIGSYHPEHKGLEDLVKILEVPAKSIKTLFAENDVTSIGYLKIDVEGVDVPIVEAVIDQGLLPKEIRFEAKRHEDKAEYIRLVNKLYFLGYNITTLSRVFVQQENRFGATIGGVDIVCRLGSH